MNFAAGEVPGAGPVMGLAAGSSIGSSAAAWFYNCTFSDNAATVDAQVLTPLETAYVP